MQIVKAITGHRSVAGLVRARRRGGGLRDHGLRLQHRSASHRGSRGPDRLPLAAPDHAAGNPPYALNCSSAPTAVNSIRRKRAQVLSFGLGWKRAATGRHGGAAAGRQQQ